MESSAERSVRQFLKAMYPPERAALWIFALVGLFFFGGAVYLAYRQHLWDRRLREWEQIDAVVTRNELVRARKKRGSSHTELRYVYTYRGRSCTGRAIVYDLDRYPPVPVGSVRRIVVDPAAPERSAALVTLSGYRRWIRYKDVLPVGVVAAVLAGLWLHLLLRRPPEIPAELLAYLEASLPAETAEKPPKLRDFGGWVSHPPRPGGPEAFMLGDAAWLLRIVALLFAVAAGAALWYGKTSPGLAAAFFALLCALGAFPPRLKIDPVARTIIRKRLPWGDDPGPEGTLEFSAIRRLEVIPARMDKRGMVAVVAAVTDAGDAPILASVTPGHVAGLLAFLPDLATELGRPPVVFRTEVLTEPRVREVRRRQVG